MAMTIVPYHIEHDGVYYSLSYVYDTRELAEDAENETNSRTVVAPLGIDSCCGQYTVATVPKGTQEGAYDDQNETTVAVVDSILSLFQHVSADQHLEWYKPLEPENIATAVERVQWRRSIAEVGGELVSRVILSHGLPNANHRTSIAPLELYARTFRDLPTAPQTNTGDEWIPWVNEYIRKSKRLITVRRNAGLFSYLRSLGASGVRRKNDVVIEFAEYPPDVEDSWGQYQDRHEQLWIEFARRFFDRWGVSDLADETDEGKRILAARL